ncbi:hypothetical protein HOB10_02160 [Candidatus Parcubacteria bacterium]|jgi:hypothetical protein|nr:hypothetical protein [Candidatus Parcubacteria bacterium]
MTKTKKNDFIILIVWNIIAFTLSFIIGINYIITAVLFFLIPSIYISLKNKDLIKKSTLFSILFSTPTVVIFSYLAHKDGAWKNYSIINLYIFNTYPIDDFIWGILYVYYMVIFYEYFFDKNKKHIPNIFYKFIKALTIITLSFLLLIILIPQFYIPYVYILGVLTMFILLPCIILINYKKIMQKLTPFLFYFFYMFMLYEYVANIKGNWSFPGQHFIGHFKIFSISFPLEEFLWALLAAPAVIVYYEFFADDRK